jgi:hypothetical protein
MRIKNDKKLERMQRMKKQEGHLPFPLLEIQDQQRKKRHWWIKRG